MLLSMGTRGLWYLRKAMTEWKPLPLTAWDLAGLLQISRQTAWRLATGRTLPTLMLAVKIDEVFGIPPGEWLHCSTVAAVLSTDDIK